MKKNLLFILPLLFVFAACKTDNSAEPTVTLYLQTVWLQQRLFLSYPIMIGHCRVIRHGVCLA